MTLEACFRMLLVGIALLVPAHGADWRELVETAAAEPDPARRAVAVGHLYDDVESSGNLQPEERIRALWYGYFLARTDAERLRVAEVAQGIASPDARMILFGLTDAPGLEKPVAAAQKALDARLAALPGARTDASGRLAFGDNAFDRMAAFERFVEPPAYVGRWSGNEITLDLNAFPSGVVAGRLRWDDAGAVREETAIGFADEGGLRVYAPGWKGGEQDGGMVLHAAGRREVLARTSVGKTGKRPPTGAKVLFDGRSLAEWTDKNGGPAAWKITPEGWMEIPPGVGDHRTRDAFGDVRLYLEYRHAFNRDGINRKRGNSGVYLQSNYEIQLTENFANATNEALSGAIYHLASPAVNASAPPMEWQSLEVEFRTPRIDAAGHKTANARMSVWHNGVKIHDAVELPKITGGGRGETAAPLPVNLQAHGGLLQFRNIWAEPLAAGPDSGAAP